MAGEPRRVTWTDEARSALDEALSYIAEDSPLGASSVLEQALKAAESLVTLSHRGRVVPERNDPTIREIFVGSYRLLYEVTESEVLILTFLHGGQGLREVASGAVNSARGLTSG